MSKAKSKQTKTLAEADDAYFKKVVLFRGWKQSLRFQTSQSLFSSDSVDAGSQFLLRTIVEANREELTSILDLGCGYGPIGLTLKSLHPDSVVHMVDRDALAVEYSRRNAGLNGLSGVDTYGSLGYDDVKKTDFDLIASNVPGKAGEPVIAYLLREAASYLSPGGVAAVVVVTPLETSVTNVLTETPGVEIVEKRSRSAHIVFHYRFVGRSGTSKPAQSSLDRGIYQRNAATFRFANLEYRMQAAYGLPEFDSLSFDSELLMEAIRSLPQSGIRHAAVVNPGQGHIPIFLWKVVAPDSIALIDRDLLTLRHSRRNLISNGCAMERVRLSHQVGARLTQEENPDFIAVKLGDDGPSADIATVVQASDQLHRGGLIAVSGTSTAITRVLAGLDSEVTLRVISRERYKGYSVVSLQRG